MTRISGSRRRAPAARLGTSLLAGIICAAPLARAAETALAPVVVRAPELREDPQGPVFGYKATRSSTATRTDTPVKEIPQSITIVPSDVIKDQSMQGMADVLRYVPGATVHQGEGNRDQVVLRGISTTADFFVNGVRDDAQIFRDLYNIERVEVLKGPAGMAFGRGGAGGVVNRVTKRPSFDRVGEASFTVGSYDQLRTTLDVGNSINEAAAWRLNAMTEESNGFRNGYSLRRSAVNPAVTFKFSPDSSLTLDYEHLHDLRTADRGIPSFNGAPVKTSVHTFFGNAAQSNARTNVDALAAVFDHDIDGNLKLRNTLRVARYDKFYQNVFPGSAVTAARTLTLSAYNNANARTNVFNQTDLIAKFATGSFEHTLLTGLEVGHQNSDNRRRTGFFGAATSAVVSVDDPLAVATAFTSSGTDADNNVRANMYGVYVQDQVAFSQQWKMLLGVRYDSYRVSFDDRRTTTAPTDLARSDTAYSPRAGLIWTPTARSAYYVSYSTSFLPSGEQLSLAPTNADLAPEKAQNYEVGARWDVLPALTLSTAVFRTDRTDVHVTDPANPGFFVKSGKQRTEGVEVGLQGDMTKWWHVYGGYAHLDGQILAPISSGTSATTASVVPAGRKIGLVPEHTFSVWNKFDLENHWAAALGLVSQSSAYTSFNNTVKIPGFGRLDGAVYYTFSDHKTRLALNVENVLGKEYYPTVDGDNNISVGAPRNARLTLSTLF